MSHSVAPENGLEWKPARAPSAALMEVLRGNPIRLQGLLPWSSNYTFLGDVIDADSPLVVVYKPIRGERPLWDFPQGTLARREVAAFEVSHALGWHLVPPTVFRDGPHGPGSVQYFVDLDQGKHYFTFHEDPAFRSALQKLALFDLIVNNADRKGGHCLQAGDGCIVAVDHGVCFHVDPKLRTVIWDFARMPIPPDLLSALQRFGQELGLADSPICQALERSLSAGEIDALRRRLADLIAEGRFPDPPEDRRPFPWPLV